MITNSKTSQSLSLASALLCVFTPLSLAADGAAPSAAQARPSQQLKLATSTAPTTTLRTDYLQANGSFSASAATATRRMTFVKRANENLKRHVTVFRGPVGPTLPAGATLHRNPAAVASLLEVTAAPDDLIFDLPPGAFLRRNVPAQTQ